MVDTSLLNENQFRAVNWSEGPILVLAGPGSGKTNVLTHRIARLVEESTEDSFRILGLTFTNKAAAEMRKRVKNLVPNAGERINLTTFHSFSAALLRQHGHHLGIGPDFIILSQDTERMAVLDKAIERVGTAYSEGYTSSKLLPLITRLTECNVQVDTAAEYLQTEFQDKAHQIGAIYGHYRQLMIENNELDFGALVAEALKLLTTTTAGRLIRSIYPYVCVDEFQDTGFAQYQILCSIVDPDTKNLFVVADDDQIIYEWNGASPERLQLLREYFNMTVLELPENYRCPSDVVTMANMLISNNSSRSKTNSVAGKPDEPNPVVRVRALDTVEDEADWVAKDIAGRSLDSRSKCAVLARTCVALEQVISALKAHGLHGHLYVRKDEFTNGRMVWLHSMLRLANSRQDGEQLRRVCKSFNTLEGLNLVAADIVTEATVNDGDYLRAWMRAALRSRLSSLTNSLLKSSVPRLSDNLNVQDFVSDCFEWFERRQEAYPEQDYGTEYKEERDVWDTLITEAAAEMGSERMTLSTLLQYIDLRSKESPAPAGSIPCYTIYASKGMGFDHVYLVRLAEDELPNWRAVKKGNKSREMQEERRVCFVAITRTQKSLTLTYPRTVWGYEKKPSRFLAEMGIGQT